jgi:hypothetical protein
MVLTSSQPLCRHCHPLTFLKAVQRPAIVNSTSRNCSCTPARLQQENHAPLVSPATRGRRHILWHGLPAHVRRMGVPAHVPRRNAGVYPSPARRCTIQSQPSRPGYSRPVFAPPFTNASGNFLALLGKTSSVTASTCSLILRILVCTGYNLLSFCHCFFSNA